MKKAFLQMHASIFLWGFTGILGRLIELNEGLLVWYRMCITVFVLLIYMLATTKPEKINRKELLKISAVGMLVTIHWLFFYGAIKYSNVSVTLSCLASTALFTSIFEPIFNRTNSGPRKINPVEIIFALMAGLGIYLIFDSETSYITGIVLALLASAFGALFTVLNKNLMANHRPEQVTLIEISSGLIFLSMLMPLYLNVFPTEKSLPNQSDWMFLFALSVCCTVIPFVMSLHALKKVSAFTINLSLNLEPVYGIMLAFWVFGENKFLGKGFYMGAGIILISVIMDTCYKYFLFQKEKARSK